MNRLAATRLAGMMGGLAMCATIAAAAPTDLDTAWGSGGVATVEPAPGRYVGVTATIAIPGGGGLVAFNTTFGDVASPLLKLNREGRPDASFGAGGRAGLGMLCNGPVRCSVDAAALDASGGIVTLHGADVPPPYSDGWAVARFAPDGHVDTTFGTGGVQLAPGGSMASSLGPAVIAVDAAGRIFGGVSSWSPTSGSVPELFRIRGNGTVDAAFGTAGVVTLSMLHGSVTGIAPAGDGSVYVATGDQAEYRGDGHVFERSLVRLAPDGTLDTSFGAGGILTLPIVDDAFAGFALAAQSDGRLLLATIGMVGAEARVLVVRRLNPDGSVDAGFGVAGVSALEEAEPGESLDNPDVVVDSSGRILVSATHSAPAATPTGRMLRATILRLTADGTRDVHFAGAGVDEVWSQWGFMNYGRIRLDVQDDGRILLGGLLVTGYGGFSPSPGSSGTYEVGGPSVLRMEGGATPVAHPFAEARAVEYFHAPFDHYFVTTGAPEIAQLDMKGAPWVRTGKGVRVLTGAAGGASSVCRFWSSQAFAPKSSHFYTPYANECAFLKQQGVWQYEGDVFALGLPAGPAGQGTCAAGSAPLYRLYNDGQGGAPNHRYTDNLAVLDQMVAQGWVFEGEAQTKVFACIPAAQ